MRLKAAILLVGAIIGIAGLAWVIWPRPENVEITIIARAPATRLLAVNGRIRPRLSVDVQAPVAGTITSLPFDVGDWVGVGTLLATIDDAPQRAAIVEAQAAVAAQQDQLAQARRELARYTALGEFVTRQRREEAQLQVDQGDQALRQRRAALVEAREIQKRLEIRAPFAGVITERPVDPGQTIGGNSILYRLANLASPQVAAEVDEIYAVDLQPGSRAFITLPGNQRPLRATVTHIQPRVDPTTGAREVRLQTDEPLAGAPSGLTASVNIVVDRQEAAISVARTAILNAETNPVVRVVGADGVVSERSVRFVDWPADSVIVTQGLSPGMEILADPLAAGPGDIVQR